MTNKRGPKPKLRAQLPAVTIVLTEAIPRGARVKVVVEATVERVVARGARGGRLHLLRADGVEIERVRNG